MAKLLSKEDFFRLAQKDLSRLIKHFQDYEKKFPEEFKGFVKEPFVIRTLKTIEGYQTN